MKRRDILECSTFWIHRLCRFGMGTGALMTAFVCMCWIFQLNAQPFAVLLALMTYLVPLLIAQLLRGRIPHRPALLLSALGLMVCCIAPIVAVLTEEYSMSGLLLLIVAASLADTAFSFTDEAVERCLLPEKHYSAAERVRSFKLNVCGILAPAAAGVLLAYASHRTALLTALILLALTAFGAIITNMISGVWNDQQIIVKPTKVYNKAAMEIRASYGIAHFCMAAAQGALLVPMLLSRTTTGKLAIVLICEAVGFSVGQLFNPLQSFYAHNKKRGFAHNCMLLLCFSNLLFGMARMGWQWNILGFAAGVTASELEGGLEMLHSESDVFLKRMRLAVWGAGALFGSFNGSIMEWIMAHINVVSRICARLTGLGEGSGMAMSFVVTGFAGILAIYVCTRMFRKNEE